MPRACLALAGLLGCGAAPVVTPPANHTATVDGRTYDALFTLGRAWALPCTTRSYFTGRLEIETTLRCHTAEVRSVGTARVAHLVCDEGDWVNTQLAGWYLADERGLWRLESDTITEPEVHRLREDYMLLAASPSVRKVDEPGIAEGMRVIVDTPVAGAWCVQQVTSYGGAPNWRTFCYQDGKGLVGASQANGEAGHEERCGIAPNAQFRR